MKRSLLIETTCSLLILLFFYASASKLFDYPNYYGEMNGQPLPNALTPVLVWGIPLVEIAIAIALMIERTRLVALWASLILLGIFSVYIALILLNAFDTIPCACGGVIRELGWKGHLIFNACFMLIAAAGIVLP